MPYYRKRSYRRRRARRTQRYGRYKRYGTGAVKRATLTKSLAGRMWAVVKNPFSLATNNPKIPDGRAALSAGQKYQVINELPCGTDGEMTLALFPGIGAGLTVWRDDGGVDETTFSYQNHGDVNGTWSPGVNNYETEQDNIAMWRLVSQGLQLSLTNNMEENDGWYESVRITMARDPSFYHLVPTIGNNAYNLTPHLPPSNNIDEAFGIDRSTWIEHPTYTTGKLKEIHRMPFLLQHEANSYEFRRILNTGNVNITGQSGLRLNDNAESRQFVHDRLDDTFDIILIRIHGRTDATTSTRILCHLCSNQEIVYENGTTLSRFHTECVKAYRS